jgi:hypothetical protein
MLHLYLDRIFITMDQSIGALFLLVKGYLASKSRAGDAIGKGRRGSGTLFEKSAHLLVESPAKRVFLSTIQAGLSCTPLFHEALGLGASIPGVIGVPIEGSSLILN